MAGDAKKLQPIIVKRIKKGGHAAHGGAWKIAYADFVTAMMAFFLLMWLLGSTTEGDRKGIQDYFNNPVKVSLMGGQGSGDTTSVIKGGGRDIKEQVGQTRKAAEHAPNADEVKKIKAQQAAAEAKRLQELSRKVEQQLAADPKLAELRAQIRLDMTPDGLRIQIVDEQSRPMFASGSAVVQPYMRELLRTIGGVLAQVPNKLTLEGHTDAAAFGGGAVGYSNWELSSDRANASRRELIAGGLADGQMLRVQGLAASALFDHDNPLNPINRRISIIVMNRDAEDRFHLAARGNSVQPPALDVAQAVVNATQPGSSAEAGGR
ncbi:MAG TPA: flagellar motor protein MotB [Methylibium sp.]|uniref:flagellar motor protein MotB n=1 Tax=Methylibium sp. TaxID=2067992 RepID=UPI002DB5BF33|nr:flagellar motor protein MotB [Methylibium sp.]HEU4457618.1 flagellar motor protein MotB [Methylibium sp.]